MREWLPTDYSWSWREVKRYAHRAHVKWSETLELMIIS